MSAYVPFLSDPAHIRALEGQRFVVLRVPTRLSEEHRRVRAVFRERLDGQPVSYPAEAHVTLCGFSAGADLSAVQALVRQWAATIAPLSIELLGLGFFPPPFQIVVLEVRKTESLSTALLSLRREATRHGLPVVTAIPVDDWRFHMSVAYCDQLSMESWQRAQGDLAALPVAAVHDMVGAVEIVAFNEDDEHSGGLVPLGAP